MQNPHVINPHESFNLGHGNLNGQTRVQIAINEVEEWNIGYPFFNRQKDPLLDGCAAQRLLLAHITFLHFTGDNI